MPGYRLVWLALSALAACLLPSEPGAAPGGERAQQATVSFGDALKLFQRSSVPDAEPGDGGAAEQGAANFELYIPQPGGSALLVPVSACDGTRLQTLFGVKTVTRVEQLDRSEEATFSALPRASWTLPCPGPKPRAVQRDEANRAWLAKLPTSATRSDADGARETELVIAIPQSCVYLIEHFQVMRRAREQRGADSEPPWTPDLALACEPPSPPQANRGFRAEVVLAGNLTPLIQLSHGDSTLHVSRVDGIAPSADDQALNNEIFKRLAPLLQLAQLETSLRAVPLPEVALDLCAADCDAFVPSHLRRKGSRLACLDESAPDARRSCPRSPRRLVLREHIAVHGARVQDVVDAGELAFRGPRFAACEGQGSWARVLGLPVEKSAADLLAEAQARYADPDLAPEMPCVRDTSCSVAIAAGQDISAAGLLRDISRRCWHEEDVLTLQLGGGVTALGTLSLAAGQLPASIKTVRLVGPADGAEVAAPTRLCGVAPCPLESPVLSLRGPLRFEIEGLRFVAQPASSTKPPAPGTQPERALPGNRVAIDAREGATLVIRHSEVGLSVPQDSLIEPEQEPAWYLYTGVRATDAAIYLYNTDVRAFATALDLTRSRVAVLGNPLSEERLQLRVLEARNEFADLVTLDNRPLVQPTAYTAMRMSGTGSRAFVAGVRLWAPVGIVYVGPGTRASDLTVVDSEIGWNPECKSALFRVESRAIEVVGEGDLHFDGIDVRGVGSLLRCATAPASVRFDGVTWLEKVQYRLDPGLCRVTTDFDIKPEPCAG